MKVGVGVGVVVRVIVCVFVTVGVNVAVDVGNGWKGVREGVILMTGNDELVELELY